MRTSSPVQQCTMVRPHDAIRRWHYLRSEDERVRSVTDGVLRPRAEGLVKEGGGLAVVQVEQRGGGMARGDPRLRSVRVIIAWSSRGKHVTVTLAAASASAQRRSGHTIAVARQLHAASTGSWHGRIPWHRPRFSQQSS